MTFRVKPVRRGGAVALVGLAAVVMTACGSPSDGHEEASGHKLTVVASTSVWASVVQEVGGDAVQVESLITDPTADPHSYESTPQDAAKISNADIVVLNGGGYDEFMEQSLAGAGQGKPAVRAVDVEHAEPEPGAAHEPAPQPKPGHADGDGHAEAGHRESGHAGTAHEPDPGHAEQGHEEAGHDPSTNEHVWYDLPATQEFADKIASELSRLQPQNAERFHQSAEKFRAEVSRMQAHVDQIAAANQGKEVIVTEPVANYLVEATKLTDITPQSFAKAVEAENDPPAAGIAEIQTAIDSRQASAVLFNPQTQTPVTQQVKTKAEQIQTPVVEMRETLPQGQTYLQWMSGQITALDNALKQKP